MLTTSPDDASGNLLPYRIDQTLNVVDRFWLLGGSDQNNTPPGYVFQPITAVGTMASKNVWEITNPTNPGAAWCGSF